MARNRRINRRVRKAHKAQAPKTAAAVGINLRRFIRQHAAALVRRLNHNAHGWTASDILASFGPDAAALTAYVSAAAALGIPPASPTARPVAPSAPPAAAPPAQETTSPATQ